MSDRFAIVVQAIDDAALVAEIEQTIRCVFQEMSLPGSWRVIVRPSVTGGRWDFNVHGRDVRHTLSIAVPPHLLPTLIPRRLEESLNALWLRRRENAPARTLDLASGPVLSTGHRAAASPGDNASERASWECFNTRI
jgi:hypothetical protein